MACLVNAARAFLRHRHALLRQGYEIGDEVRRWHQWGSVRKVESPVGLIQAVMIDELQQLSEFFGLPDSALKQKQVRILVG